MPDPLCPFVPYDPGDAGIARGIKVQTVTLHRTIGTWAGDYSVGKHRTHDQGTFQFLIGQFTNQWVQFFPVNTFASHAAGSNEVGPGIEISGQNGEPLTPWQIKALGQILRWLRDEWGIAPTFIEGDPRVYYDQTGPSGFVCHNSVFYPDPQYIHHDYITAEEFATAITSGVSPAPVPLEDDDMPTIIRDTSNPPRTLLVTADEVYEIDKLTTANVVATKEQADFIIADVRVKYQARAS